MRFSVRRVREEDWPRMRDLRLQMLQDSPKAYLETYETAVARDEAEWRFRARRGAAGNASAQFAAIAEDGTWVGTMAGFVETPGTAWLVAVFVAPDWRGRDRAVAGALLAAVQRWAAEDAGAQRLLLEVHEDNARARAYYRRAGFVETGVTVPYPLEPSEREVEMSCPLPVADH